MFYLNKVTLAKARVWCQHFKILCSCKLSTKSVCAHQIRKKRLFGNQCNQKQEPKSFCCILPAPAHKHQQLNFHFLAKHSNSDSCIYPCMLLNVQHAASKSCDFRALGSRTTNMIMNVMFSLLNDFNVGHLRAQTNQTFCNALFSFSLSPPRLFILKVFHSHFFSQTRRFHFHYEVAVRPCFIAVTHKSREELGGKVFATLIHVVDAVKWMVYCEYVFHRFLLPSSPHFREM